MCVEGRAKWGFDSHLTVGEFRLKEKILWKGRRERFWELVQQCRLHQQSLLLGELKRFEFKLRPKFKGHTTYHVAVLRCILHLELKRPMCNVGIYLEAVVDVSVVGRERNDQNFSVTSIPGTVTETFDKPLEELPPVRESEAVGHKQHVLRLNKVEWIVLARRFAEVDVKVEELHVLFVNQRVAGE